MYQQLIHLNISGYSLLGYGRIYRTVHRFIQRCLLGWQSHHALEYRDSLVLTHLQGHEEYVVKLIEGRKDNSERITLKDVTAHQTPLYAKHLSRQGLVKSCSELEYSLFYLE